MKKIPGTLILARHHESEWNKLGLWTGTRDRHLTPYGFERSEAMGKVIADLRIDHAFASGQVRAIETLASMLNAIDRVGVPSEYSKALNERDYGKYTGKNKWDMQKLIGTEEWEKVRREWDYPVPDGESLRMVYERAVPFFTERILPLLAEGKNVLVVAHGNSCRALIKYMENVSDEGIKKVEMPFGGIFIYSLDEGGKIVSKETRMIDSKVNA